MAPTLLTLKMNDQLQTPVVLPKERYHFGIQWRIACAWREKGKNVPQILKHYPYLKNGVFWDVTPCVSCKNRRFGGT
jgi:hypothetical protein